MDISPDIRYNDKQLCKWQKIVVILSNEVNGENGVSAINNINFKICTRCTFTKILSRVVLLKSR